MKHLYRNKNKHNLCFQPFKQSFISPNLLLKEAHSSQQGDQVSLNFLKVKLNNNSKITVSFALITIFWETILHLKTSYVPSRSEVKRISSSKTNKS